MTSFFDLTSHSSSCRSPAGLVSSNATVADSTNEKSEGAPQLDLTFYIQHFEFQLTECTLTKADNGKKRRINHRPLCYLTIEEFALEKSSRCTRMVIGHIYISNQMNDLCIFNVGDISTFRGLMSDFGIHGHPWPLSAFASDMDEARRWENEDSSTSSAIYMAHVHNKTETSPIYVRISTIKLTADEKLCLDDLKVWALTCQQELAQQGLWTMEQEQFDALPTQARQEYVMTAKLHQLLANPPELHLKFERLLLAAPVDANMLYAEPNEWEYDSCPAVFEV